ncbi:hypothetical protein [Emcibacter sp.]
MSENKKTAKQEQQDKLAEALRANLKRRKDQSRKPSAEPKSDKPNS